MNWLSPCAAAVLLTIAASAPHGAAAQPAATSNATTAHADIKDAQGKSLGTATLTQMAHGVVIKAELSGLPAGPHGFHVHEVGKCEAPAFTSAGGHFNPTGHKHGYNAAAGPHSGDLPNIIAKPDGTAIVEVWVHDLALADSQTAPGANALFDQDGASLVIHAQVDDYASDPAGNSGNRIACGVIER
jgi:Cu-Zn family superoxide dismutase